MTFQMTSCTTETQLLCKQTRSRLVREPSPTLFAVLPILVAFYLLFEALDVAWMTDAANLVGPLVLGLTASLTGYRLVRRQPLAIWTPYLWFLGGILLFYSIGPLVYVLGSNTVRAYLDNSLPINVSPTDLLRTNMLNTVGIFFIFIGMRMARSAWSGPIYRHATEGGGLRRAKTLTIILLIMGGALQYLLILPWKFGVYDIVLPGMIANLENLFLFGLMGLAYVVARGGRKWKLLFYTLWSLQILISILYFSKTALMLSLLLPLLGFYLAKGRIKYLLITAMIMALAFISVTHLIHYGRQEVIKLSGNINQATLGQRMEIVGQWLASGVGVNETAEADLSNTETGWARLSYVNVQTFAINQYDAGMPGDSLKMALIVLIPRALWPEKPITTNIGVDFYELVTGIRLETHLGLGLFGEAYWNLGWFGLALIGIATGTIFWIISSYAINWMSSGAIEYMPGIFLGINMGMLGTTQDFANAVVGGAGLILMYALVVSKSLGSLAGKP